MSNRYPVKIAPSILSADFGRFTEEVKRVDAAGADWIHCDVMDGQFVPNITFGPDTIRALRQGTQLPLDVHLMIQRPELYVERFIDAGADHVIVHVEEEAKHDVSWTLNLIKNRGKRAGISLNPPTPAEKVIPFLHQVDIVLVMTVHPGFGGQSFMPETVSKIRKLRAASNDNGKHIDIAVDGGINPETGRLCVDAGANVLVAGNSLFRHKTLNLSDAIRELRTHVQDPN